MIGTEVARLGRGATVVAVTLFALGHIALAAAAPAPPQLSISLSDGRSAVDAHSADEYTITLVNRGTRAAHGTISLTAPSYAEYQKASGDGAITHGTVRWTITLGAGESRTEHLTVRLRTIPKSAVRVTTLASFYLGAGAGTPLIRTADADRVPGRMDPASTRPLPALQPTQHHPAPTPRSGLTMLDWALIAAGVALLIGAGLALTGVWPNELGALILMGVFGVGNTLVDVSAVTLMQRAVRDDVLGRVFGALESLLVAGLAAGALATPPLLGVLGTRGSLIVVGALLPVLTVALWARLRTIDERAQVPTERIQLLTANAIFAPLPPATIEHLAVKLSRVPVRAGEAIFRQGDPGDLFYIVESGRVRVEIDGETVNDLWPGEAFGEIALLRDVPRTATVTPVEDTTLLSLERDDFIAAVTGHAPSREAADALIGARLASLSGVAPV
jgi:hypothetical protein